MLEIDIILISIFLYIVVNYTFLKYSFFLDKKFFPHKSLVSQKSIPVSGGFIFVLIIAFFFQFESNFNYLILLIFFVGALSDLNYLKSPLKRFILQISIIFVLIFLSKNFIFSIRIQFFDNLLTFSIIKYFFVIFCLLVLINGSNFIDGVNTLLIGYFLSITLIILLLISKYNLNTDIRNYEILFSLLLILFVFNFFEKFFCGDGGSYAISLLIGFYLIQISKLDYTISPYFIACLLWYPAYECLFSMVRKKIQKSEVTGPDQKHLHQLLFIFFSKRLKFKKWIISSLTGISINLYNLFTFLIAYLYVSQTKTLISLLIFNLVMYNFTYFILRKVKL
tara:strand:+ start:1119 stop:2129 length:1011 start_codon:yes stop_codon:yes gene_type:complete